MIVKALSEVDRTVPDGRVAWQPTLVVLKGRRPNELAERFDAVGEGGDAHEAAREQALEIEQVRVLVLLYAEQRLSHAVHRRTTHHAPKLRRHVFRTASPRIAPSRVAVPVDEAGRPL